MIDICRIYGNANILAVENVAIEHDSGQCYYYFTSSSTARLFVGDGVAAGDLFVRRPVHITCKVKISANRWMILQTRMIRNLQCAASLIIQCAIVEIGHDGHFLFPAAPK